MHKLIKSVLLTFLIFVFSFSPLISSAQTYDAEFFAIWNKLNTFLKGQTQLAQTAPTSGLIAHYTFNEGSGTTAGDSAGSNTGTLVNGPTWTSGHVGGGISFSGTAHVSAGSPAALDDIHNQGGLSIAFWVNPSNVAATGYAIGKGNSGPEVVVGNSSSPGRVTFTRDFDGGTDLNIRYNNMATQGTWQHFVVVWNGQSSTDSVVLYKDGVAINQTFGTAGTGSAESDASNSLTIGGLGASSVMNGSLDDVRIYNRVLSSGEVSDLYNATDDGGGGGDPAPSDDQSPSAPTNLSATAVSSTQVNLSWNASSDNVAVTGYRIYRNGSQITTTSNTSYNNTGLSANTTYTYTVTAYDAAGNESSHSSQVSATTPSAAAPTYTVTISPAGNGSGTVTSNVGGINCGQTCTSTPLAEGTSVILTAAPATGSTFGGWSGVPNCLGITCTITSLSQNTTVTATFSTEQPASYTLQVNRSGTGGGTVTGTGINCGQDCSESFESGTGVTLRASASNGSVFSGWSGGGCTGTGNCVVTINAATTIVAMFDDVDNPPPTPTAGDCSVASVRCVPSEYASINACSSAAQPGDTCVVSGGSYGAVSIGTSGTSGNPITYYGGGTTITGAWNLSGRSHVRVIGFEIQGGGTSDCMNVTNTNFIEIWDNTISGCTRQMIGSDGGGKSSTGNNSIYSSNTFETGNESRFFQSRGNNNIIEYNTFNGASEDYIYFFGNNNIIRNNYGHSPSPVSTAHVDFLQTGTDSLGNNNLTIEANFYVDSDIAGDHHHFSNMSNGGADFTNILLRRNIAHQIGTGVHNIFQNYNGVYFIHEGYMRSAREASEAGTAYGFAVFNGAENARVYNTIGWHLWGDSEDTPSAWYFDSGTSDYNLVYDPDNNVSGWTGRVAGEANSLRGVNPLLQNYNSDLFYPTASSPGNNRGGALTRTTSSGSGSSVSVIDAGYFRGDNSAITQYRGDLVIGDMVTIGSTPARVQSISGNTLTLDRSITWSANAPVYWGTDTTPDIGAYPYLSGGYNYNVNISSHSNGESVSGVESITASINNPEVVRHVVFFVNGVPTSVDNQTPYTFSWDTSGLGTGSQHLIEARAYALYASKSLTQSDTVTLSIGTGTPLPPGSTATLTITNTAPSLGTITGTGINCGVDCTHTATVGTSITLTATPATGSTFTGWSGGGCIGTGSCTVTLNANTTVTATFTNVQETTHTVTVTRTGSGTITGTGISCGTDCSETLANNTQVTLIAVAATGYSFSGWGGACVGGAASCTFTISGANVNVSATFTQIQVTDSTPPTVTMTSPSNNAQVAGNVTVSANASDNVAVAGVRFRVDGANLMNEEIDSPYLLTWDTTQAVNGTHTITATARDGAGNTSTTNPITVTVANVLSTAFDDGDRVEVTTSGANIRSSAGGSVIGTHSAGALGTIVGSPQNAIVQNVMYVFWYVNFDTGVDGWIAESFLREYTPPTGNPTVTYNVSVGRSGSGSGTVTGSGISCGSSCFTVINAGSSITLVATPASGSVFGGWSLQSCASASCTFTPISNVSVTATFNQAPIDTDNPRGGGGGGGGGSRPPVTITRTLDLGSTGADVTELQTFLADEGLLARTDITGRFNITTENAVKAFQRREGIVSSGTARTTGYGVVGPQTRAAIARIKASRGTPATTPAITPTTPGGYTFTRTLRIGTRGEDVRQLQIFLNTNGFTVSATGAGSRGLETTYYGAKTAQAVTRFQEAYRAEILTPSRLTRGTGTFGPSTMRKVNSMMGTTGTATTTPAVSGFDPTFLLLLQILGGLR